MTKRFKLSEAASAILEGAKENFAANVSAKQGMRGSDAHKAGEVGDNKLAAQVAYGEKDAGIVGHSPEKLDDKLPEYLKGTPKATPPGATPPVGSEKDGVGISKPKNQPQETMGRSDVMAPEQSNANQYPALRDRARFAAPKQTFSGNPGSNFQTYGESIDMSEDIKALLDGESLSEEFADKATTIFEAAVISRVETIAEEIENNLIEEFEIAVEQIKEDLSDKLDDYIAYMAEEYMNENALAIDSGLRSEIAEDFISGLRNLFVEHYINIPEDKVDVVSEMAEKIVDLEAQLNEQFSKNIEFTKQINEQKKIEAIYTACDSLTQTQVEKMKSLAESVEFTTESEFHQKLETLKESYFKSNVTVATQAALDEVLVEDVDTKVKANIDPNMAQYARVISKNLAK